VLKNIVTDRTDNLTIGGQNTLVMEKAFPRLLHLLAHHTDFSKEESDLDDMVTYLNFYLDCVGTSENYPLLFHLAQRVKQSRDAVDEDKSEVLPL
jgi:sister chromatid cohesion protein PDS5